MAQSRCRGWRGADAAVRVPSSVSPAFGGPSLLRVKGGSASAIWPEKRAIISQLAPDRLGGPGHERSAADRDGFREGAQPRSIRVGTAVEGRIQAGGERLRGEPQARMLRLVGGFHAGYEG